jgi:hypothetical protein
VNHFKGLGAEQLRSLDKALSSMKQQEISRLSHIAVKESAASKDPLALAMVVARQAGRIDAVDNLLSLIYDADKP